MKKKIFIFLMIAVLILSTQSAFALSPYDSVTVEHLDNGDYIVTVIENVHSDSIMPLAKRTETKSKTSYYKNAAGSTLWYVKVTGTFTYGDGTSTCIQSIPEAESYNDDWKISNISGSKSGNKATATATAKKYYLGVVIDSRTETVTLTCSSTGVFS